ncbi:helix-turn-helix domain-containing protein [Desulfobotulus mexicanus]|uniref:HTH cro/C1-type domain-containing protein n=1 Tax=Desulfobotulus mexicanus TaxID=2586642 RepID=A0A5Q4VD95_9BACT|nr:helix-turn-helix transcriptional regulator [Desulfobotulus mexicanus]TYT75669.1 hypothetical protein FIM25_04320 [Desulfobotulus mexicanus]
MNERMTIHQLIDERIRTLDITPKVLAAHMNVTEASVSRWRRGIAEPKPQLWPELFAVLQITPEEVLPPASGRFIPSALIHPVSLPDEKNLKSGHPSRTAPTEQAMVDVYESRLQDMRTALERADKQNERMADRVDRLESRVDELMKTVADLQAEKLDLLQKITDLTHENITLKTELAHPLTPQRASGES